MGRILNCEPFPGKAILANEKEALGGSKEGEQAADLSRKGWLAMGDFRRNICTRWHYQVLYAVFSNGDTLSDPECTSVMPELA